MSRAYKNRKNNPNRNKTFSTLSESPWLVVKREQRIKRQEAKDRAMAKKQNALMQGIMGGLGKADA